jgi:hypothetical protein
VFLQTRFLASKIGFYFILKRRYHKSCAHALPRIAYDPLTSPRAVGGRWPLRKFRSSDEKIEKSRVFEHTKITSCSATISRKSPLHPPNFSPTWQTSFDNISKWWGSRISYTDLKRHTLAPTCTHPKVGF